MNIEENKKLVIIQLYAPTLSASKEEIDLFYNQLTDTVQEYKTGYKNHSIVMGDFNSQIGKREDAGNGKI